MIVVDSSVWIDFFNGVKSNATERLNALLGVEPILVGDLILLEVLQGFRSDRDFEAARTALSSFAFAPMLGAANALASARNFRRLRGLGVTVRKTIDIVIATFCVENGHALLHADRDFDACEAHLGLVVVR